VTHSRDASVTNGHLSQPPLEKQVADEKRFEETSEIRVRAGILEREKEKATRWREERGKRRRKAHYA